MYGREMMADVIRYNQAVSNWQLQNVVSFVIVVVSATVKHSFG